MLGNAACDGAIFLGIPCIYDSDGDPVDPGGPSVKAPFFPVKFYHKHSGPFLFGGGVGLLFTVSSGGAFSIRVDWHLGVQVEARSCSCGGLEGHAGAFGFTSGKPGEEVVMTVFKDLLVFIQSGVHWISPSASHRVFVYSRMK